MTQLVLIAGADIAGLCTGIALMQRGFRVTICEQAEVVRETDAGVQISPNGTRVLARLAVEPTGKTIRLWNSGESWSLFDLRAASITEYGFPYLMVHRGDLHATLTDAVLRLDPDAIRQGAEVVDVDNRIDGVTVSLSSGDSVSGDILIGANGIHSGVRARSSGPGRHISPDA